MRARVHIAIPLTLWFAAAAGGSMEVRSQEIGSKGEGHSLDYWRSIVKNHYAVPSRQEAFALTQELSQYFGSPNPLLRDQLAYSIIYAWIVDQKLLSHDQLTTLLNQWEGNLRIGIGETNTDSVFLRSFSVLGLATLAERDLKDPFLGHGRFRTLLGAA